MTSIADVRDEYLFLEGFDRIELLIDQGKALEPMPDALKTDTTLVKGCTAEVWTYPTRNADGTLHFLADSKSGVVKGIIALVLMTVQDKQPADILNVDVEEELRPFEVSKHLSSKRTSGIPNMIALIRETALRYA
ncbi:SufE family protein [Sphingomonas sp. RP10(2022)]|uniref:SufE family protein n=1 Tax=Sphingomonas liriopis TaxID=2949094 RepID=A0A9X2KQC9_9SPHN|nr:SufE family protein [Sphingomonas liriopis]MCP3734426.1 SufE family protein [Sphingomonas liriopis]